MIFYLDINTILSQITQILREQGILSGLSKVDGSRGLLLKTNLGATSTLVTKIKFVVSYF